MTRVGLAGAIVGCLLAVAGIAQARPGIQAKLPPLATPSIASGVRTFVAFPGQPAKVRIAWAPVSGATRYRARWVHRGDVEATHVDVELPGTATSFEHAQAIAGHHELSIVALDGTRESSPATIPIDVVTIAAIAPGARQSEVPSDRVFGIGTRFSSGGLRCQLGDAPLAEVVQATRAGAMTLACGGEPGQPHAVVPIVIAPTVVATTARPVEIGTPTHVHVTVASVVEFGDGLLVEPIGDVVIGDVERTPTGFEVEVTAGSETFGLRIVGGGYELGRVELEGVAPIPAPPVVGPTSDWRAVELGGHVGFFVPPTTNIGRPVEAADAVSCGSAFRGARRPVSDPPGRHRGEVGLATTGYAAQPGVAAVLASRASCGRAHRRGSRLRPAHPRRDRSRSRRSSSGARRVAWRPAVCTTARPSRSRRGATCGCASRPSTSCCRGRMPDTPTASSSSSVSWRGSGDATAGGDRMITSS